MALPALVGGADCGPLNPLQSLSKQFDRDRGVQQDHFGPGRASTSRENFRTRSAPAPGLDDAARFFSGEASGPPFAQHVLPDSFDLSSLRGGLPQQKHPVLPLPSPWAGDFLNQSTLQLTSHQSHSEPNINPYQSLGVDSAGSQYRQYTPSMNSAFANGVFRPPMQMLPNVQGVTQGFALTDLPRFRPEAEPVITQADFPQEEIHQHESYSEPIDADELSRTAGLLVDAVKEETNPKFQNSAFLGLMRQLRDKELVVEGAEVVKAQVSSTNDTLPSTWAQDFTAAPDVKGKGKARADIIPELMDGTYAAPGSSSRKSVHFSPPEVFVDGPEKIEDSDDRYWRQENQEYQNYWSSLDHGETQLAAPAPDWDRLQDDWDRFEATATGIKPVSVYQFQPSNPYLVGDSSTTRNHTMHAQRIISDQSVLEKEAFVQNNPRNAIAWYELGVKQQENERETHAVQALQRAVELDPSYLEAWLALAISYTNENDKAGAYDAIEQWVRNNERYGDSRPLESLNRESETSPGGRQEQLIQCLMALARTAPDGEVDADIQTALGVLLNTSEEYGKAQDCFRAALAVRPNDWLLYNRVGATLANSGQSSDALQYYYRALELNPSYIRARFNLGISCINLKSYDEAAVHILDALVLQENDASDGGDTRGITSSALWDCLRTTCLQLQRAELASLCDSHDLDGFRKAF
ncbi:hypothetical protein JB92DRAFT_2065291 [Gautieria morchelliformis]|nr:hypothetical protein JB92DRAFT_2065291 [Gautieria morchelliformis]